MDKKKMVVESNPVKKVFQSRNILLEILTEQGYETNEYLDFDIYQIDTMINKRQLDMILKKPKTTVSINKQPIEYFSKSFLQLLLDPPKTETVSGTEPTSLLQMDLDSSESEKEKEEKEEEEEEEEEENEEENEENEEEKIYIRYELDHNFRFTQVESLINQLYDDSRADRLKPQDTLFIVIKDDPNDSVINGLENIWETRGILVVIVPIRHLQFNKLKNVLVPQHRLIKDKAEIRRIMKKCNIRSPDQFPKISRFDGVGQLFCPRPGNVFEILRSSPTAGLSYMYRICINTKY
jgi:DNA-directed RNA polymerase subunit H (RpoH/RPB5)